MLGFVVHEFCLRFYISKICICQLTSIYCAYICSAVCANYLCAHRIGNNIYLFGTKRTPTANRFNSRANSDWKNSQTADPEPQTFNSESKTLLKIEIYSHTEGRKCATERFVRRNCCFRWPPTRGTRKGKHCTISALFINTGCEGISRLFNSTNYVKKQIYSNHGLLSSPRQYTFNA